MLVNGKPLPNGICHGFRLMTSYQCGQILSGVHVSLTEAPSSQQAVGGLCLSPLFLQQSDTPLRERTWRASSGGILGPCRLVVLYLFTMFMHHPVPDGKSQRDASYMNY